jgi:hypothetical protein
MRYYLLNDDRTAREVSLAEWMTAAELVANIERRDVGDDQIQDFRISSKFIGIDTTDAFLGPDAPPRPFECFVFGPSIEAVMGRFSSWDEAKSFHTALVDLVRQFADEGQRIDHLHIDLALRSVRRQLRRQE